MSTNNQAAPDFSDIVCIIRHHYLKVITVHIEPNVTTLTPDSSTFDLQPSILRTTLETITDTEVLVDPDRGDGKIHLRTDVGDDVEDSEYTRIANALREYFQRLVGEDKVFFSALLDGPDPS